MDADHPMRERTIAGYRVLRTLARGDRSEILLGFDPPGTGAGGPGSTVALKVIADSAAAAAEVEALTRAAGEHVVKLIDVSLGDTQACLVLERLERGSLSDLVLRRIALDAGEVVTIVAPLVGAIDRLHDSGVAHGGIAPGAIAFSASGAPVLTGFGSAVLFPAGSPEVVRERIPAVLADRRAIGELAIAMLRRVEGGDHVITGVEHLLAGESAELLGRLADLLFGFSAATPVRFAADPDPIPSAVQRVGAAVDPVDSVGGDDPAAHGDPEPAPAFLASPQLTWLTGVLPDGMRDRLSRVVDEPFVRELREKWQASRQRRRRAVLAAGAVGLTVAVAMAVPSGEQHVEPDRSVESAVPSVVDDPVVVVDDPVDALRILWARRLDCLRERSILCLDAVDQPGSAALAIDRALVAVPDDDGAPPDLQPDAGLVLVERLGDSALVDLPDGFEVDAVLLMRGDGGWRIRDYLVAPAETEQAG